MNEETYIEVSVYQLNADIEEADFLETSEQVSEVFRKHVGFQHRDLMRSNDKQWVDMIYWENETTAKASEEALYASPVINTLMSMLNTETMVFTHVHPVKRYSGS